MIIIIIINFKGRKNKYVIILFSDAININYFFVITKYTSLIISIFFIQFMKILYIIKYDYCIIIDLFLLKIVVSSLW
jgi:hypothetical protein